MFFNKTIEEVLKELESNPITGLSQNESRTKKRKIWAKSIR